MNSRGAGPLAADVCWDRLLMAASAGLFLAALWTPIALHALGRGQPNPETESRSGVAKPHWPLPSKAFTALNRFVAGVRDLGDYPAKFDEFFSYNLPYRGTLAAWHNQALVDWLGTYPGDGLILGKDHWCYLNTQGSLAQYRRLAPLPQTQVEDWAEFLTGFHDWLEERGVRMLFVLCANKETVYPEFMPDAYNRLDNPCHSDQLLACLADSRLETLDFRPALLQAKGTRLLYYRQDSHWNNEGVFLAHELITKWLARSYPAVRVQTRDEFETVEDPDPPHDVARMMRVRLPNRDVKIEPKVPRRAQPFRDQATGRAGYRVTETGLPDAVLFHDSFFLPVVPFLSENFARSYWHVWTLDPRPAHFGHELPDVVIYEFVERHLTLRAPSLSHLHSIDFAEGGEPSMPPSGGACGGQAAADGAVQDVQIPIPQLPPPQRAVIRLSVWTECEGVLSLHYTAGTPAVPRRSSRPLGSGCNEVFFKLPEGAAGPITVHFAGPNPRFHLTEEARVRAWRPHREQAAAPHGRLGPY